MNCRSRYLLPLKYRRIKFIEEARKGKATFLRPVSLFHMHLKSADLSLEVKCGFPLAEVRMKQKTFFSHASGNLGASVRDLCGGLGHIEQIALDT